jgi:hypothetical protein
MTKNVECKCGFFKLVFASVVLVVLLVGCSATGTKYQDMANAMPALGAGQGRIFFFRPCSAWACLGGGIRPMIYLNDEMVGTPEPLGFFFVDRPAGNYTARSKTETENTASFVLEAGETKYLSISITMGMFVGHVSFTLEVPDKALAELSSLHYTGDGDK